MKPLPLFLIALSVASAQTEIRGFSKDQAKAQREREDQARAVPEPKQTTVREHEVDAEHRIAHDAVLGAQQAASGI